MLLLIILNQSLIPQSNESINPLSRYRISFGYVNLLLEDSDFEFHHPFFNWSFRSSGFDKASSSLSIEFAFEPGINGLIVSKKIFSGGTDFSLFFIPYAKFGPEMRLGKNIFLGISLGLILASYETSFFPFPFFGVNGFYLVELNESLNIEIESGFHSTFSPEKLPLLFYITAGISFN